MLVLKCIDNNAYQCQYCLLWKDIYIGKGVPVGEDLSSGPITLQKRKMSRPE